MAGLWLAISLFSFLPPPHFYSEAHIESMNNEAKWQYSLKRALVQATQSY